MVVPDTSTPRRCPLKANRTRISPETLCHTSETSSPALATRRSPPSRASLPRFHTENARPGGARVSRLRGQASEPCAPGPQPGESKSPRRAMFRPRRFLRSRLSSGRGEPWLSRQLRGTREDAADVVGTGTIPHPRDKCTPADTATAHAPRSMTRPGDDEVALDSRVWKESFWRGEPVRGCGPSPGGVASNSCWPCHWSVHDSRRGVRSDSPDTERRHPGVLRRRGSGKHLPGVAGHGSHDRSLGGGRD